MAPLIDFEKKKPKPIWKMYQMLWANIDHNELPPILTWDNNRKGKQKKKLTWKTDDLTWTNNDESEPTSSWEWEENKKDKRKGKEREKETIQTIITYNTYTIPQ
ncbi:hypothetical protein G9A89_005920 [Geosiphon pyriformis]|nr:hypothetical protein G9A89_005920 [Geosiphon pyriformis]